MPYRIEHWSKPPPKGYETAKTKLINYLSYVPLPNKIHDADYVELLEDHEDGPIHLAVFVAMLQFVSLQHKDVRNGWLTRNGRPDGRELSPIQIAKLIRIDAQHVTMALKRLADIGWVKYHEPVGDQQSVHTIEDSPGPEQGPNEDPAGTQATGEISDAFLLFKAGDSDECPVGALYEPRYDYPTTFMRSPHIVRCFEIAHDFYAERLANHWERFPGIDRDTVAAVIMGPPFIKLIRNGAIVVELLARIDGHTLGEIAAVLMFACVDTVPRNGFCWSDVINSIPRLRSRIDGVSKFAKLEIAYRRHEEHREREGTGGFMNAATERDNR